MKGKRTSIKRHAKKISRREFMAGAATAAMAFTIVPRHVLGGAGHTPPSEKLNIAGVGVGGMGASDLQSLAEENIVALCDVHDSYAAKTFKTYPKAKVYKDYRRMLDKQKDIEAVVVATPDHTHACIAMAAIKAGKHVYVEKPLAYSIFEVRKLAEAARQAKVATQMGNQGHASEDIRNVCEWIADGAIGAVREVHAWTTHAVWPQGIERPKETPPVPADLDWDRWVGPAPYRPYHPAYLPGLWRGWWDFGTGALGDMGCHVLDAPYWALNLGYPTSVEASASIYSPGISWDKPVNTESYPRASIVRYEFGARGDMPPVKLTWYDGGMMPPRPAELEEDRQMGNMFGGAIFIGDKGKIMGGGHGGASARIIPESKMKEYNRPPKTIARSPGHHAEWVKACKSGQAAGSNFDYAGPFTEVVLLGNVALRMMHKKLYYDGPNMKVINLAEANEYIQRQYRQGWTL
ncbi:MAG: Gfo/Idh/MocA family protein [Planctomycetota bacterium]|jgi:predicted dehydrogenase